MSKIKDMLSKPSIVIAAFVVLIGMICVIIRMENPPKTNPPPGYYLEVDQNGYYRPCREDGGWVYRSFKYDIDTLTRKQAIKEAWYSYNRGLEKREEERKEQARVWTRIKTKAVDEPKDERIVYYGKVLVEASLVGNQDKEEEQPEELASNAAVRIVNPPVPEKLEGEIYWMIPNLQQTNYTAVVTNGWKRATREEYLEYRTNNPIGLKEYDCRIEE